MTDTLTAGERSERMRRVKSENTAPELALRRIAHALGFRYRVHGAAALGRPDIVNARRRIAIFLHGCFWHRHRCAMGSRSPKSRVAFWTAKFERNVARDRIVQRELRAAGWRALVVWECELRSPDKVRRKLERFLHA